MAADSRITYVDPITNQILSYTDGVRKIYCISKANVGISYWGLAEIQKNPMLDFLTEFEASLIDESDSVDTVAEKLKKELEKITPKTQTRVGFHIAGYTRGQEQSPRLRHLFHETWHSAGIFTNEDSHTEHHTGGRRVPFPSRNPYPVLFNGDNAIANCLFNYIPIITRQRIEPESLTIDECLELAELIVGMSIQRLNYYVDPQLRKLPPTVGGTLCIARITPAKGFEWYRDSRSEESAQS